MNGFKNVREVVDWMPYLGCGACVFACPQQKVSLVDFLTEDIRPVLDHE